MGSWLDKLLGRKQKSHQQSSPTSNPSEGSEQILLSDLRKEFQDFLESNLSRAHIQFSTSRPVIVNYFKEHSTDWSVKKRTRYLLYLLAVSKITKVQENQKQHCIDLLINHLERKHVAWTAEELRFHLSHFDPKNSYPSRTTSGLQGTIKAYAKTFTKETLPIKLKEAIELLRKELSPKDDLWYTKRHYKMLDTLDVLLSANDDNADPFVDIPDDRLGEEIKQQLTTKFPIAILGEWAAFLRHLVTANSGKPSSRWLSQAKKLQPKNIGIESLFVDWISFAISLDVIEEERTSNSYTYTVNTYLSDKGLNLLKGIIWAWPISTASSDPLQLLTKMAERGYEKIPVTGPLASRVSNACLFKLSQVPGLEGVAQLSRLGLKIKHATARKTINKYLAAAAEREGVSVLEIEEMSVDHHGLTAGVLVEQFDDYRAELSIEKPGRSTLVWYRPDGRPQKSVPTAVKTGFAERLKQLRKTKKLLDKTTSAQRDRIDRLLRIDNRWPSAAFAKTYEQHGVLNWFAQRLIWQVRKEADDSVIATIIGDGEGGWILLSGESYTLPTDVNLSLWHPALAEPTKVNAWRKTLDKRELQQPIKQAYREIYLLTPAELNTEIYSNRMAGHLLRQHQYVNLARLRGWRATLLGCWDSPDDDIASLMLPDADLEVQFYVQSAQADNAYNDAGIWNYITTDQVRFVRNNQPLNLAEVPALIFSEVMRDCDLFVGVASVGNDPEWQDRGETPIVNQYGGYWREYSFGKLQEVAKSRKAILERLVPRLKIRDVAQVKGNFLEVRGHLHTYKIHIGSGNILMEPNDQYLCIVPGRGKVKTGLEKSFIPFEGDRTLSVIISKALLLADDKSIEDPTITRQL